MVSAIQHIIPESRLLFVQISSIYQKTAAKARYKDSFEEMEHEISLWNNSSGKSRLPFQMFRKFSAGTTQKAVFH